MQSEACFLIRHQLYQKGETRQGAVISGLYLLCDGKVMLARYTEQTSQSVVRFLGPGDFFGALVETKASPVEARVLAESVIAWLDSRDLQELLIRNPFIALEIQRRLAQEVSELYVRLAEQAHWGTRESG